MGRLAKAHTFKSLHQTLRSQANAERAKTAQRFFKTGPGHYGFGDKFLGVTVPQQRVIVKQHKTLALADCQRLLQSPWHEERLVALLILVEQFQHADTCYQAKIIKLYLHQTAFVNNWDLVDSSADKLLGEYIYQQKIGWSVLQQLASSKLLWERRIAMIATYAFIKHDQPQPALKIARILVHDDHDLIQKAVGWMVREVEKRCSRSLAQEFLEQYAATMPRTMLRYAIERLSKTKQQYFLKKNPSKK